MSYKSIMESFPEEFTYRHSSDLLYDHYAEKNINELNVMRKEIFEQYNKSIKNKDAYMEIKLECSARLKRQILLELTRRFPILVATKKMNNYFLCQQVNSNNLGLYTGQVIFIVVLTDLYEDINNFSYEY